MTREGGGLTSRILHYYDIMCTEAKVADRAFKLAPVM